MQIQKTTYFPELTGIRAVAAFLVFFHHYNPFERFGSDGFFRNCVNEFHVGVSIFFVLSGLLISFRYHYNINASFRRYILNRFARIYPVYFLLTGLTFLFGDIHTQENIYVVYIVNITLLKGLFYELNFTGIQQGWSLTVEELFYFSAPFFFYLIRKNKIWLWLSPILLISTGYCLVLFFGQIGIYGFFKSINFMLLYTYFGRSIEFFTGIYLGIHIRKWKFWHTTPWLTYTGTLVICLCISMLALLKGDGKYGLFHPAGIFINNVILPILGVLVLFTGLILETSRLKQLLSSRLMVLLGKSSYVFYLIHMGFFADLLTKWFNMNSLGKFIVLNLLSILIFKLIEEPLNHLIKRLGQDSKQAIKT